jgi:hypothetical protein
LVLLPLASKNLIKPASSIDFPLQLHLKFGPETSNVEQCIAGMMIQIQIGTYELYDYILNSDSNSIKQGETLGPLGGLQQNLIKPASSIDFPLQLHLKFGPETSNVD